MTFHAIGLGSCFGHLPGMRPVTVFALHVHVEMDPVLAHLADTCVTPQTVFRRRPHLPWRMRFVAFVAVELHGRFLRKGYLRRLLDDRGVRHEVPHIDRAALYELLADILVSAVTEETFLSAGLEIRRPFRMAINACETAHGLTVHLFIGMTLNAKSFRREKPVEPLSVGLQLAMTLSTFNLLHVHVPGMEQRFVYPHRLSLGMALVAVFGAHNDLPVPLGHLRGAMEHEADKQLVHFRHGKVMTIMTIDRLMFALLPARVRRLHDVTAYAELGIVLAKIIEPVCDISAADKDHEEQRDNKHLGLQRKRLAQHLFDPGIQTQDLFFRPTEKPHPHSPLQSMNPTRLHFISQGAIYVNTKQKNTGQINTEKIYPGNIADIFPLTRKAIRHSIFF